MSTSVPNILKLHSWHNCSRWYYHGLIVEVMECGLNLFAVKTHGYWWFQESLKERMGTRAFSYKASVLWNHLPGLVWGAETLSTFKSRFKTFLFYQAYRCLFFYWILKWDLWTCQIFQWKCTEPKKSHALFIEVRFLLFTHLIGALSHLTQAICQLK